MPLPVIEGVFRITLNWSVWEGITPRNVFHIGAASADVDDIGPMIDTGIGNTADPSHMFSVMSASQVCTTVDILPLDGTTATQTYTLSDPLSGGAGSSQIVPQVAAVVSLRTGQRGARGRGRVYAGPAVEDRIDDGMVVSTYPPLMVAAWEDFNAGLGTHVPPGALVVASYAHVDANLVTSVHVDEVLGTQRRRQDQLRV